MGPTSPQPFPRGLSRTGWRGAAGAVVAAARVVEGAVRAVEATAGAVVAAARAEEGSARVVAGAARAVEGAARAVEAAVRVVAGAARVEEGVKGWAAMAGEEATVGVVETAAAVEVAVVVQAAVGATGWEEGGTGPAVVPQEVWAAMKAPCSLAAAHGALGCGA